MLWFLLVINFRYNVPWRRDWQFKIYFSQELAAAGGKNTNAKASCKNSKKVKDNLINQFKAPARDRRAKSGPANVSLISTKDGTRKTQKAEPLVKEEGEMSDDEEVYEQFKEQKWMEWCEDVLADEIKTLGRLQRLQTTSADLPKEKVSFIFFVFHHS